MKKNGLTEIAKLAGVSVATTSRALNNTGYVSSKVKTKVLSAASKLGYIPTTASKKRRLGVIFTQFENNLCNFYRDTMLAEISRQCSELDVSLEMVFPNNVTALEDNFIRTAIVLQRQEPEIRKKVRNVNFVSINGALDGVPDISTDNKWCMTTGIDYLIKNDCRKILLVIPNDCPSGMNRSLISKEIITQANINNKNNNISLEILNLKTCNSVKESLKQAIFINQTDALFIAGEDMASMITYELFQLGIKIPDDLSILSFEAPGSSCYMTPAHTTVQQDFSRLVSTALDWALKINAGESIPNDRRLQIPGFFNERESVKQIKTTSKSNENI